MKDRVSPNPGRVLITPEDGSGAFYATLAMADNPTVVGDPLNKNTFLKDATAALFGLGPDAVPDDVIKCAARVTGTRTISSAYGSASIKLGSKPDLVILYDMSNNQTSSNGPGATGDPRISCIPVILTSAYVSESSIDSCITETGFHIESGGRSDGATYYYIAFRWT